MNWESAAPKVIAVIRLLLAVWIAVIVVVLCATGRWWGLVFVVPLVLDLYLLRRSWRPAPASSAVFAELVDRETQARSTGVHSPVGNHRARFVPASCRPDRAEYFARAFSWTDCTTDRRFCSRDPTPFMRKVRVWQHFRPRGDGPATQ